MREAERGDWRTWCLDSKQLWKHLQSEVAEADTTERHLLFTLKLLAWLPWKFCPLLLPVTSTPHKLPLARADLQIQRKGQHFLPGLWRCRTHTHCTAQAGGRQTTSQGCVPMSPVWKSWEEACVVWTSTRRRIRASGRLFKFLGGKWLLSYVLLWKKLSEMLKVLE